jgi:glucose-6-phosphate isomerase
MNDVTDSLENEGVKAFIDAFNGLISVIDERRKVEISRLSNVNSKVHERLQILKKKDFVNKLWAHDPGLWTDSVEGQREITQRMNWLEAPWNTQQVTNQTRGLLDELIEEGYTHALVLGMGGSSLAPEVISKIYNSEHPNGSGLHLSILDSTHPDEVAAAGRNNPIGKTLFIVSSKSGTTGEINAFLNYFYDLAKNELGNKAGAQFMAITDPGTKLETLAKEKGFRRIITADPQVGGRNSALTAFGLVPALLCGMDIEKLIKQTQFYARSLNSENDIENNPGLLLGAILGESALAGKGKLTILADGEWAAFGAWMEQLIAESSGKDGKGILPITDEPLRLPSQYANDRLFVYLRKDGRLDTSVTDLVKSGHPVIQFNVNSALDLGYQFYLWETATAVACSIIGVNSFDQPNVQDAKTRTLAGIESYRKTGQFIIPDPEIKNEDYLVYSNPKILFPSECTPLEAIKVFIKKSSIKNGYLGINAFVPRDETNIQKLDLLRKNLENEFGITTTMGFGPRYLHSTGQFHKGGPDNGIFVLLTNTPEMDIAVPGEGITFSKFCFAQALGDEAALAAHGRKTLRIHFTSSEIKFS